ncbi:MAG TPA: SAM-dependent methyltransferase [Polyangiaceae bacterium]|jgi:tRNA-Thr(GGU) m(6)t(6)A37 methyltransferase TsaA|nr:SAM-dependent methyltransferase [Polyangiaceae bacterium]
MSHERATTIEVAPIGWVRTRRATTRDDFWGAVTSTIEIDPRVPVDALAGLAEFSHLEVVYQFHAVPVEDIEGGARHPRGRADWPLVGIFAQRGKMRPNRLGISRCNLVAVEGRVLTVRRLDAIDGTPVLDIKPYMREFGPIGEVSQPAWATELMRDYYLNDAADPAD